MRSTLEAIAETAGADVVIYDRRPFQNILMDEVSSDKTICLITEISSVNITTNTNGLDESYTIEVAFVKKVDFEEKATLNETTMNALYLIAKKFILGLVNSNLYQRNITTQLIKYQERESDYNAIGWRMSITLNPIAGYAEC